MNAELTTVGQTKIIILTVYREDYLGALRKLTRKHQPDTFIRMLQRAQQFSATIAGADMDTMQRVLEASNVFKVDPDWVKGLPKLAGSKINAMTPLYWYEVDANGNT